MPNQNPTNGRQSGDPLAKLKNQKFTGYGPEAEEENLGPEQLAEIWAERAHALAEEPPVPATGQTIDLLLFWLSDERHGVEVTNVREIYPLRQLTPVPRAPNFVAGVFSARGRILSVIDLRAFFGLPSVTLSDQTKIIVVSDTNPTLGAVQTKEPIEVGLLADRVDDVITLFKETIEPPLATHTGARSDYIQGIGPEMLVVLNLTALLGDRRFIVQEETL